MKVHAHRGGDIYILDGEARLAEPKRAVCGKCVTYTLKYLGIFRVDMYSPSHFYRCPNCERRYEFKRKLPVLDVQDEVFIFR